MTQDVTIKPCPNPWCFSTSAPVPVGLTNGYGNRSGWVIQCACGVKTWRANTRHAAISGWNTRRPPPDRPDLADLDRTNPAGVRIADALARVTDQVEARIQGVQRDIARDRSRTYTAEDIAKEYEFATVPSLRLDDMVALTAALSGDDALAKAGEA